MSRAGGGWGGFLRSFAQAFLKSSTKRGSARPQPGRGGAGAGSGVRTGSGSGSGSQPTLLGGLRAPSGPEIASPGQYGDGATRDLSRGEIERLRPSYGPKPDGDPDPGEIVWTWVPYVENDGRGKDRPVLIIARIDEDATAGCYLSTKRHDGFVSIGAGPWDSQGRESYVSPERVLRISNDGMRREGHVLPLEAFERAVAVVAREQGFRGA